MRFQSLWQMPLLLGVAATSLTYAAAPVAAPALPVAVAHAPAAVTPVGPVDTAALMKQIEDLKKQVSHIAYKQRKSDEKLEAATQVEDAKIGILQANQISPYPEGYISIPGTNSAIKIGGRIKADFSYYPGGSGDLSGGSMKVGALPIRNVNPAAGRSGSFGATAQASRIEINSLTRTNRGDVKAQIQTDFYGSNSVVSTTTSSSATSNTSSQYGIRLRQAWFSWNGLLAGQTDTNFHDADLMPALLDGYGSISVPTRRPQVRWTQQMGDGLSLSVAAEKSNTDYTTMAVDTGDNGDNGKSAVPDFTARLRYDGKQGFVSLRGVFRTLQVRVATGDTIGSESGPVAGIPFSSKANGWGLGFSGKLITSGLSNLYMQGNVGNGLGYLIDDANGQAAYLQVPTTAAAAAPSSAAYKRFNPQFNLNMAVNGVIGYEHWWTDQFRTNIAGSYTKIKNAPNTPIIFTAAGDVSNSQVNARVKKLVVNAIYSPVKCIDIGVEVLYGIRETISGSDTAASSGTVNTTSHTYAGGTGKSTQIMTSFIYKF